MRFNSHWHGIILEGGFDSQGNFVTNRMLEMSILPGMAKNRLFIPIHSLDKMTECFRRRVIRFFLDRELITESFVTNMAAIFTSL